MRVTVSSRHSWRTEHDHGYHRNLHLHRKRLHRLDPHSRPHVKAPIASIEGPSDKGPQFRIFAGAVEPGAAWQKRSEQTGRDYLSVKLNDPSFPAPIYATLSEVEGEDGYQLIWSRPNRD